MDGIPHFEKPTPKVVFKYEGSAPSEGEAMGFLNEVQLELMREDIPGVDLEGSDPRAGKWINAYGEIFDQRIRQNPDFFSIYKKNPDAFLNWVREEMAKGVN